MLQTVAPSLGPNNVPGLFMLRERFLLPDLY